MTDMIALINKIYKDAVEDNNKKYLYTIINVCLWYYCYWERIRPRFISSTRCALKYVSTFIIIYLMTCHRICDKSSGYQRAYQELPTLPDHPSSLPFFNGFLHCVVNTKKSMIICSHHACRLIMNNIYTSTKYWLISTSLIFVLGCCSTSTKY